jgi:uncharacterized protein
MSIDIDRAVLDQVCSILRAHVPDCEVWAFGSRVTPGGGKKFSDLDLALIAPSPLPTRRLALLAYAFEESDLPIKIDLIEWHDASPELRRRLTASHEVIYQPRVPMDS